MRLPSEPTTQDRVLIAVARAATGLTHGELAERLRVSSRQVDHAVRKLMRKGLIERNGCQWQRYVLQLEAFTLRAGDPPVVIDGDGVDRDGDNSATCPECLGPKDAAWTPEARCEKCYRAAIKQRAMTPPEAEGRS